MKIKRARKYTTVYIQNILLYSICIYCTICIQKTREGNKEARGMREGKNKWNGKMEGKRYRVTGKRERG